MDPDQTAIAIDYLSLIFKYLIFVSLYIKMSPDLQILKPNYLLC